MTGESEDMTAKERLLLWSKQITDGYVGVRCDNFTTSWRDGRLFNAIIHKYRCSNTEGTAEVLAYSGFSGLQLICLVFLTLMVSLSLCLQARHG